MQCFIICDNNWDNLPILSKRIKVLPEDVTIHSCYGKKLNIIEKVCSSNMKHIIRRSLIKDKEIENIYEILKYIDICLVFTDFIEYNSLSSIVKEMCIDNDIPLFTFNNHTTDYMYNLNKTDIKFNKYIKTFSAVPKPRTIKNIKTFTYENSISKNPISIDNIIEKLRKNYEDIDTHKKNNSIINLDFKPSKEYSYLEYMNNKKKWLKSMNTNR
jgi:hypothetical protein